MKLITISMMSLMMLRMMVLTLARFGHHLLHHFFPAVDISKLEYLYPALQVHIIGDQSDDDDDTAWPNDDTIDDCDYADCADNLC